MTLGVAILGTGRLGGNYINTVNKSDGAETRIVAEPREEQVVDLKVANPNIDFVASYQDILDNDDINIVVGTLPHWLHHQAAIDCLNAGKHVFLEKPMALNTKEADEMLAAAKSTGRLLMTAHTQRYFGENIKMKEIIDSGDLGEVVMVNAMWVKPLDPHLRPAWMLDGSKGGGMGQMDGTHLIDRLIWLLGDDIYSVSGITSNYTHPELTADDSGHQFFRWKSGRTASITRMGWKHGITEYGADYFFTNGQAKHRRAYGRKGTTGVWVEKDNEWESVPFDDINSQEVQFNDFVQAVKRGDTDSPTPMTHGRKVMRVFDATEESHRTGKEVIIDDLMG
jgi:phthalate 4,5-cis-dihydrodiol dehydrogenase